MQDEVVEPVEPVLQRRAAEADVLGRDDVRALRERLVEPQPLTGEPGPVQEQQRPAAALAPHRNRRPGDVERGRFDRRRLHIRYRHCLSSGRVLGETTVRRPRGRVKRATRPARAHIGAKMLRRTRLGLERGDAPAQGVGQPRVGAGVEEHLELGGEALRLGVQAAVEALQRDVVAARGGRRGGPRCCRPCRPRRSARASAGPTRTASRYAELALGAGQRHVLRHAVDEQRDARAERLADLRERHGRVLDDVVQERGGEHLLAVAAPREQPGDADRMGDVGLPVLAPLAAVRVLGERVRVAHERRGRQRGRRGRGEGEAGHGSSFGRERRAARPTWTHVRRRQRSESARRFGARVSHASSDHAGDLLRSPGHGGLRWTAHIPAPVR